MCSAAAIEITLSSLQPHSLLGTLPDRRKLDHYRSLGVSEVALRVPSGSREEVLPVLDDCARLL